jgi:predicted transcriptional regulator
MTQALTPIHNALTEATVDIVVAYIGRHQTAYSDLVDLTKTVRSALSKTITKNDQNRKKRSGVQIR